MTRGDEKVENAAKKLQELSDKAASSGGIKSKLAPTLAEDAAFLRKLKPSLIAARAKGEAPTDQEPGEVPVAPMRPQHPPRPKPEGEGRSPWLVVGIALAAGVVLAKALDWRSHAHPRQ